MTHISKEQFESFFAAAVRDSEPGTIKDISRLCFETGVKLGRNQALEEAIHIARSATHNAGDEYGHGYNKAAAEITRAIESLKDNTL